MAYLLAHTASPPPPSRNSSRHEFKSTYFDLDPRTTSAMARSLGAPRLDSAINPLATQRRFKLRERPLPTALSC